MTKPTPRMSEPTLKTLGSTPRLRPAQAAPIRRHGGPGGMIPAEGGCMEGITPSQCSRYFCPTGEPGGYYLPCYGCPSEGRYDPFAE